MDVYYVELFDYYGELFTDKQKEYFIDYCFNNLTLQEIADNNNVSRNAIHDQLKKVISSLDYYEEKLGLLNKEKKLNILLDEYAKSNNKEVLDLINKIKNME